MCTKTDYYPCTEIFIINFYRNLEVFGCRVNINARAVFVYNNLNRIYLIVIVAGRITIKTKLVMIKLSSAGAVARSFPSLKMPFGLSTPLVPCRDRAYRIRRQLRNVVTGYFNIYNGERLSVWFSPCPNSDLTL